MTKCVGFPPVQLGTPEIFMANLYGEAASVETSDVAFEVVDTSKAVFSTDVFSTDVFSRAVSTLRAPSVVFKGDMSLDTSLAVVAPGIAEALLATALGLVAAIPAVIAYNKLSNNLNTYALRLQNFASEFEALLSRHLSEQNVEK